MRTSLHRLYQLRLVGWRDDQLMTQKGATIEDIRIMNAFENCKQRNSDIRLRNVGYHCGVLKKYR